VRRADYSPRGVLPSEVCLGVISKSQRWGDLDPLGAVEPFKKCLLRMQQFITIITGALVCSFRVSCKVFVVVF
jgi:hypothetical protein